jgi:hypothetical protein
MLVIYLFTFKRISGRKSNNLVMSKMNGKKQEIHQFKYGEERLISFTHENVPKYLEIKTKTN